MHFTSTLSLVFCPADQLRHGTHGAIHAPGTGLPQQQGNNAQHRRRDHDAVKAKSELGGPGRCRSAVSPMPGQFENPEQRHHLPQIFRAAIHQPRYVQHVAEHDHEKQQKTVTEKTGAKPARHMAPPGKPEPAAQQGKKLASAAIPVAIGFVPACQRQKQGDKKHTQPNPGKKDIKETQTEIDQFRNPQIIIPALFSFHGAPPAKLQKRGIPSRSVRSRCSGPRPLWHKALYTRGSLPWDRPSGSFRRPRTVLCLPQRTFFAS